MDGRVLSATCALASVRTMSTQQTMVELDRLLGFVATHRDGRKFFHPSDMRLNVLTNPLHLSRSKAGSVERGWIILALVLLQLRQRAHFEALDGMPIVCCMLVGAGG